MENVFYLKHCCYCSFVVDGTLITGNVGNTLYMTIIVLLRCINVLSVIMKLRASHDIIPFFAIFDLHITIVVAFVSFEAYKLTFLRRSSIVFI